MNLSPEWKLVFASARVALFGAEPEASVGDLARSRRDWRRMATIACQNRVGPLVYSALRHLSLPPAAQPSLELVRNAYVATAARNAVLFGALKTVLEALEAERLPVIVLKGAALAETVYPHRALRPMADIDLLIHEEDLAKAERQLRMVGYEVTYDAQTKEQLRIRHHHWVFRSARPGAGGVPVELHWNLDPPRRGVAWDIRSLFERAGPATLGGASASVLCPEDLLLHLCLHLCRHRFNGGVIALCDIAATIAKFEDRIDWARVQVLAGAYGATEHLVVPLRLAAELMGARVPAEIIGTRRGLDRTSDLARERILEEKGDVRGAAELRLRWGRRRLSDRVAAARRALSPETGRGGSPTGAQPRYFTQLTSLLRRYGPWLWALARHPGLVSAVVRREERKSALDSWCSAPEAPGKPR